MTATTLQLNELTLRSYNIETVWRKLLSCRCSLLYRRRSSTTRRPPWHSGRVPRALPSDSTDQLFTLLSHGENIVGETTLQYRCRRRRRRHELSFQMHIVACAPAEHVAAMFWARNRIVSIRFLIIISGCSKNNIQVVSRYHLPMVIFYQFIMRMLSYGRCCQTKSSLDFVI